uniref:Uncharacterized protein n=1 Tax=Escherichia coli TaxID=562 RepID=A0A3S9LU31_ECOLX|nr:hypothetical protein [Escherichia coli]
MAFRATIRLVPMCWRRHQKVTEWWNFKTAQNTQIRTRK